LNKWLVILVSKIRRFLLRKIILILSLVIFVGGGVSSYGETGAGTKKSEARDSSGKLLYRTKTTGNTGEVRDPSGKILMRSRTTGNTTEIRNPSGKLIERIKTK
jgi:hypothetical protein